MSTPQRPQDDPRIAAARASVARETATARRRMALERAARAFWPAWAVLAAFLGVAMLGVPQSLPFLLHIATLAAFAGAMGWALWRGVATWRAPSAAEARALLDGDAPDRPAATLEDALAAGGDDPQAQALWAAHRARMAERAMAARAPRADLRVSDSDRFALRHAAALALAAGLIAQTFDGGARLAEALSPMAGPAAQAAQATAPSLEAWASPPLHTGMAPIYLTERLDETAPIALPVGSEITVRVFDSPSAPSLEGLAAAFAEQGANAWSVTASLTGDAEVTVSAPGAAFGGWRFAALPDAPPTIAFTEQPSGARGGALTFGFETSDDYGVVAARADIRLDVEAAGPRGVAAETVFEGPAFELPLPLTGAADATAETVTQDLTEHPWAGLPVIVTLTAEDGAGQTATVEARLTLPARRFLNPLAKAIVEQRRDLAWSVATAPRVRDVIDAITAHPDDIFEDATAYLTVRTARRRLGYAIEGGTVAQETPGVAQLLWEAALRLEEGDLSDAERRLRQLQDELADALERGASDEEIAELMDELRQALNEYLRQLAQEAMRSQQAEGQQPQQPIDPNQMMTQQDLMDMLDQLEEAMRNGMQDMAQQMLEQLREMLDNLQMAQPGQQGQGQGQGDQAMQELQDMIGRQQGLADRSFDALRRGQEGQGQQGQPGEGQQGQQGEGQGQQGQGQQGQGQGQGGQGQGGQGRQFGQGQGQGQGQGDQPGGGLDGIARDQEALRQLLDDLRQGLPDGGGGREALDRAEEAMRGAREALEGGDADGALQDQVDALDALREGAQQLAQEQMNQPGQAQQAGREGQSGDVRDEDPLGRPSATDGPLDGNSVDVPDASAMKRARELMDEIRRRAGEAERPTEELDYLRRLLERF
jgi:uncharacterized protein (TIGR02302 family)